MPQMAPMNWVSLYLFFSMLYIFMIIMNYYMFLYKPKTLKSWKKKKIINWKW